MTGARYLSGDYADRDSFSLRVLAEHARSSTMLINDGVFPSNEGRGYVLRRILRRAVRHGKLLGRDAPFLDQMASTVIEIMEKHYPELKERESFVLGVVTQEEGASGLGLFLAHELVTRTLGGSCELLDTPGGGLTVQLTLPMMAG